MSDNTIIIKHNQYRNLSELLIGLEQLLIEGKASNYTVIVSGDTDPLISPLFSVNAYSTFIRMDEVARRFGKKIKIEINTRMPKHLSDRSLREIFHVYSVGINYFISNTPYNDGVSLLSIKDSIKKLETWDFKHPLKTRIVVDIDNSIHPDRLKDIHNSLSGIFIPVDLDNKDTFRKTTTDKEYLQGLLTK